MIESSRQKIGLEHDWMVGHMMEMSKLGLNQCLDKMAASFAKA
jgi:hypothetical protein